MALYIQRYRCSQLFCLLLVLAVCSIPLAEVDNAPHSVLIPLATNLVPLGPAVEAPLVEGTHFPDWSASTKVSFGPLPDAGFAPEIREQRAGFAAAITTEVGKNHVPRSRAPPSS